MNREIHVQINAKSVKLHAEEQRPLLDVLREDLGLSGTKYGCGEGECGACTVLVDGRAVRSCVTTIGEVAGKKIETIEGQASGDKLHAMQQAFLDDQALQCGYCVPGQIMTAVALVRQSPNPSRQQIVEAMSGNICRCCNYPNILAAVERVAQAK